MPIPPDVGTAIIWLLLIGAILYLIVRCQNHEGEKLKNDELLEEIRALREEIKKLREELKE
ncbi:MAG: hypothetical protein GXN95_06320 [Methanococci archaeon]|nr:hypothetical protein [Methanococci archaeon]